MARTGITLAVILIVLTAGCSGLFGGDEDETATPAPPTETPTPTQTPEGAQTPFPADAETDEIVLRLSDIGFGYNFTGESVQRRTDASGETQRDFEEKGILKQHKRVFTLAESNQANEKPTTILSTVVIYETEDDAATDLQNTITNLESDGANVSQQSIASGITATQVTFQGNQGLNHVILYGQENNMLYFVMVTGEKQYHKENAIDLFMQMVVDI